MLSLILLDLSLRQVLTDIPHDAGAVIVYVLIAVFAGFVWAGSRRDSGAPPSGSGRPR